MIDEVNKHQGTSPGCGGWGTLNATDRGQGWVWLFPFCPHLSVEYGRVNLEVLELSRMRSSLPLSREMSRVGFCRRCPRPSYWCRLVEAGMSVG